MNVHDQIKKISATVAGATAVVTSGKTFYSTARSRLTYTIAVNEHDFLYSDLHRWLLEQIGQQTVRAITAVSEWRNDPDSPLADSEGDVRVVRYYSDDRKAHSVRIGRHRIGVAVERPSREPDAPMGPKRIVFSSYSTEGREAVCSLLQKLTDEKASRRTPRLHILNRLGQWNTNGAFSMRKLDSVILPSGQAENLLADLQQFLGSEDDYVRRCIPYHRGILLSGPPGSGKSSVVQALAGECNLDLWYLPLKDIERDANLIQIISEVPARSILLLEDVDSFAVSHDRSTRDGNEKGASLGALLNSLDGVTTPHGLITVLTTNKPEILDPALVRPGRVDVHETIGYCTQDSADRLFAWFFGRPPKSSVRITPTTTPAVILEVCKRHMYRSEDAEVELCH